MSNIRRWATTACVMLTVVAAGSSEPTAKAAIYATLLKAGFPSLAPHAEVLVKDIAVPLPSLAGSAADWLTQWADVPPELRKAAEQLHPTGSVAFRSDRFPAGTRLVPASDIEAVFVRGRAEDAWTAFYERFGAKAWVAFSDVLFTADQADALVYYEARCGGMCGEGFYVWLHRDQSGSAYVIKKKILSWAS